MIAIGASAGGLDPTLEILQDLPSDFHETIIVAIHQSTTVPSYLREVIERSTPLPVVEAVDHEFPKRGTVYTIPRAHHLAMTPDGELKVIPVEPEDKMQPSVDRLFVSLAVAYGPKLLAVVLSGALRDGSEGVCRVEEAGGQVIVQSDAKVTGMPSAALETGCVDRELPIADIPDAIVKFVEDSEVDS